MPILFSEILRNLRKKEQLTQDELADKLKISKSAISMYENGNRTPDFETLEAIADFFNVNLSYLIGEEQKYKLRHPNLTFETVTFPVVGSIAAGYDEIAVENWSGETVEIPLTYLKGRKKEEYFVLSVKGDSMYPLYMDGDKVLILRQSTLNHSGEIGAVLYEGENATLKKVEYVDGEDWMKLVPINPQYKPKEITNSDLEQCRILGIPRLLIREI
ncbi:MAG: LexA family transcriptional regulator [Clostridia bacterium]|nr:LexA family transcriptional regulator [Clostridia bacterium]